MCANGAILGAKIRSCISSAPSSRLLILTSPVGLEEDNKQGWVSVEKVERQFKYRPSRYQQTPPIPDPEVLDIPIQVVGKDPVLASVWAC